MTISTDCGHCGSHFSLPDKYAGRKARCTRCGEVFTVPEPELPLSSDDPPDLTPPELKQPRPVKLNLAASRTAEAQAAQARGEVTTGPIRGFWADAIRSFALPFVMPGPAVLAVMLVLQVCAVFLSFVGFFGALGQLIIVGYIWGYYLNVVRETTSGSDEPPSFSMSEGIYEDIVQPILHMLAASLWVMLPAIAWSIFWAAASVPGAVGLGVFLGLVGLGTFMWPAVMLAVAINGPGIEVMRFDQQLLTIGKSFVQYLAVWLMLLACFAISFGFQMLPGLLARLRPSGGPPRIQIFPSGFDLLWGIVVGFVGVYVGIVAMRIIGLFYRHNKHRFPWIAE